MASLGRMIGTSPQHLIIRAKGTFEQNTIPQIGEPVYNIENERVGKIADIFGPTNKPFISVKVGGGKYQLEDYANEKGISFYTLKKKSIGKQGKSYGKTKRTVKKPHRPKRT